MPQWIASIGDGVSYDNAAFKVVDISYRTRLGSHLTVCTADQGEMYYMLKPLEWEGTPKWVTADSVGMDDQFVDPDPLDSAMAPDEFWKSINVPDRLIEMGMKMIGWLDGLEMRPDNSKLYEIVTLLLAVQYDKEGFYGSSWKGKGEYRGIMANLDRKYDRLDKITDDEITGKRKPLPTARYEELEGKDIAELGESKVDAIADLANYCLLYLSYIKDTYPGAFDVWVSKNVPKYLRDKIPFIAR